MAKRYVMTAARKAALRKAQLASARKRRGKSTKSSNSPVKKSSRRLSSRTKLALGVGAIAAGYYGAKAYSGYKKFKKGYVAKRLIQGSDWQKTSKGRVGYRTRSVNELKKAAGMLGVKMTRKEAGKIWADSAKQGTSGSRSRTFVVGTVVAKKSNLMAGNYRAKNLRKAQLDSARKRKGRHETRLRQLRKVSERSLYNAGLSSNVGGRTFVSGRGGTYRR